MKSSLATSDLGKRSWITHKAKIGAAIDAIGKFSDSQMIAILPSVKFIRENQLYMHGGYATFDDFCTQIFDITARRFHQLFDIESVKESFGVTGNYFRSLPGTAILELKGVEPDQAIEIIEKARAEHPNKKATVAGIKRAKARIVESAVTPILGTSTEIIEKADGSKTVIVNGEEQDPAPPKRTGPLLALFTDIQNEKTAAGLKAMLVILRELHETAKSHRDKSQTLNPGFVTGKLYEAFKAIGLEP